MRADRLLSIMLLLQVGRRLTAGELARRLGVSARTIHRDMEALSGAGVPVVAERGTGGGWSLLERYRTDLTGLGEAEVQALFLATPSRLFADLGLDGAAEGALIKLLAALPQRQRPGAEGMRQRIHIDMAGWRQAEGAVPTLPVLQDALWRERRLRLAYRRGDGTETERVVDPLGLVAKGSLWYLVAAVAGEIRTYRVSRIGAAMILDEQCERPPDFDLAAFWAQSSRDFIAQLPRYRATLRADPAILPLVRAGGRFARIEREDGPDETGRLVLEMLFEEEHGAREFALGFGAAIEVLAPERLRTLTLEAARAVVALYEAAPHAAGTAPPGKRRPLDRRQRSRGQRREDGV